MPEFHTWIAFVAATEALLIIPGPTVLLVISYALAQGKRSAWATVPGVAAGDFTAMALSLLGLGAVLAASAELFTALKLAGAAYLIYLGIKVLRAPVPETLDENAPQEAFLLAHHRPRLCGHRAQSQEHRVLRRLLPAVPQRRAAAAAAGRCCSAAPSW